MKNIGTIELESNRLLFRKASINDSKDMFNNWASDKEVTKYLSWDAYEKEENAVSYLKYLEEEYTKDNFYNWIVVSKEDNTPIGTIGAVDIDIKNNTVEIGYYYGRKWWGKGLATESLKRVIKFFFEEVEVETIYADHIDANPASGKVMEKAGMKYEGIMRKRALNKVTKKQADLIYYSITKEDYFKGDNHEN